MEEIVINATDTPEKEELKNKFKRSVNVGLNFALEDKKKTF